uniref:PGF-CTERM sorting domain-containing protein n=1 Tax=Archaeoglobus fulgidus TaxID=2234 RepID=A0A7C3MAD3_ARCFL
MKRVGLIGVVMALLLVISATPAMAQTIALNKTSGSYGDWVKVSGSEFPANENVILKLEKDGLEYYWDGVSSDWTNNPAAVAGRTDENGNFSINVKVPKEPAGTYTITAKVGAVTVVREFTVVPKITLYPTERMIKEIVLVEGYGFAANENFKLRFTDSAGKTWYWDRANAQWTADSATVAGTTNFEGSLTVLIEVPKDAAPGTATVYVEDLSANKNNATTLLEVNGKGPVYYGGNLLVWAKLSDDRITLGETVTLNATWSYYNKEDGTRYVAILKWADYRDIIEDGFVNTARLFDKAVLLDTLLEDGGSRTWSYTPAEPGLYIVVIFNLLRDGNVEYGDQVRFMVEGVVVGKPSVSIRVDRQIIAHGDYVRVSASMNTDRPVTPVKVFVTGAGRTTMLCYYTGTGAYTVEEACGNDEWWVPIGTDRPEGTYVAKIDVGAGEVRSEDAKPFIVVKPEIKTITINDNSLQHVFGRDLVVTGTCNLAKSGTKEDAGSPLDESMVNYAQIEIKDLAGNVVFNWSIWDQSSDRLKTTANAKSLIDSGGEFKFKIDNFGKSDSITGELDRGYYIVEVWVYSGRTGDELIMSDKVSATFELVKADVKLSADKTTVTRGDDITFTISTNLKVNNPVNFTIDDTRFCVQDPNYDDCVNERTYYTDVKGQIKIKLKVNSEAPLTEYKFKAEELLTGVSDEIKVVVVKQALELTPDRTTVARGGEIRFTGTTTVDRIYVFASERGVFTIGNRCVAELPSYTKIPQSDMNNTSSVPATEKKLDFKVEVNIRNVDTGTYYLYFFAPANATEIDRSADAQAMFAIYVTDPKIVSIDIPSKIPYQGKFEVSVLTDPGKRENVELTFVLEGSNVKVRPGKFGLAEYSMPDADNYVNWTVDLRRYFENEDRALEPGLYLFTVKMYFRGGDEIDSARTSKLIEIVPQELNVDISPTTVVIGEKIQVSISAYRGGVAGYDHILVTMVGPNYKATQRATLDSEGKATLTFETYGLAEGTYTFWIRDTAGTCEYDNRTDLDFVEDLYDMDPASPVARVYKAEDDILLKRTVQLVKEKPVTPTPTTPAPTTPAPTTPAPTTPAPTTPAPTTPAPTTPAQQPGGVPGFEAVFAIAGLLAVAYLLRRK